MNIRRYLRYLGIIALLTQPICSETLATQLDPEEPIDLELKQAPLIETLQSFAGISGSQLDIGPGVEGAVTMARESTPWREVLDQICVDHRLNCELLAGDPPLLRVRSTVGASGAAGRAGYAQAIDMSLKGAALRQTLQAFGMIGGVEMIVDDAVTGKLTIEVQDTPWTVVLEEACNLSGCRIEWGESALRIYPADAETKAARQAPLAFDRVPAAEALATIARTPFFGALGQPELELAEGLEGTLSLDLGQVSWLEALNATCRAADCRWQLTYGAPSRLAVRPEQKGLDDNVRLPAEAMPLSQASTVLADPLGLDVDLDPGLDPGAEIRFSTLEAVWRDAAADLCRQASCHWAVYEGRLILNPRARALSERPVAGAEDRRINVRFFAPGASAPVEGTARFNWAAPIRTFGSPAQADRELAAGDDRWLARLSWIPFGPELDLVAPTLLRCGAGGFELELFDPVRLPIHGPVTRKWHDAILEISGTPEGQVEVPVPSSDVNCPQDRGGRLQATFRRAHAEAGAHQTTLDLEARAGTYLLVTPPGQEQPKPVAAVLSLGADDHGIDVALIAPTDDSGIGIRRQTIPVDGELVEGIRAPDGIQFELRLRSAD